MWELLPGFVGISLSAAVTLSFYASCRSAHPRVIVNNLPEELKPFLEIGEMQAKWFPFCKPDSKLPRIIENALAQEDLEKICIKAVSYRFGEYYKNSKLCKTLEKYLKNGTKLKLVGGKPEKQEIYESLGKLYSLGGEIRVLEEPPVTHVFGCYKGENSILVWFEGDDRNDEKAMAVIYTDSPSKRYGKLAETYFESLWKKGMPYFKG